ncbi:MAG: YggS family pyridoxal phosphate-dependent enzyme [Firmicutes bacterium]|nr:YggS family pyridoxal phosphate-dependent enzyme [Bacillota bacterium]
MSDLELYERGVKERLVHLQQEVAQAAARSGRTSDAVRIVGVSKYIDLAQTEILAKVGLSDLGENRWQVAQPKVEAKLPVTWHFIGPLQTNKARKVVQHFGLIHTLDRIELARVLCAEATAQGRIVKALMQVNIAREPQQSGVDPNRVEALLEEISTLGQLQVVGFMMIGTQGAGEALLRRQFSWLRELRDGVAQRCGLPLTELSMGMSNDFALAIEEGATLVRIGRRLVLENC